MIIDFLELDLNRIFKEKVNLMKLSELVAQQNNHVEPVYAVPELKNDREVPDLKAIMGTTPLWKEKPFTPSRRYTKG